jgi:hypothetical protein
MAYRYWYKTKPVNSAGVNLSSYVGSGSIW